MRYPRTALRSLPAQVCALALTALGLCACMKYDLAADATGACAGYAENTCETLNRCSAPLVTRVYGSLAECKQTLAAQCMPALILPDVLGTPAGTRSCAARMTTVSCDDLFNRTLPEECGPPSGLRADGAACWASAQCASARCDGQEADVRTGTCRELSQTSERCEQSSDCGSGLLCSGNTCKPPSPAGAACDASSPCRSPLACSGGVCAPAIAGTECGGVTSCAALSSNAQPDAACASFAQAVCGRLDACASRLVEEVYGNAQACLAQTAASCLRSLQTLDTSSTSAGVALCADAMKTLDCAALFGHTPPSACQLGQGPRPNGAACTIDAQCASSRCKFVATSTCGACEPVAQREEACVTDSDCARTLVCASDGACRAPATASGACDATHPCAYPLACAAGRCSDALAQGAVCSPAADRCDRYAGLVCDTSGHCAAWLTASPGERCHDPVRGELVCTSGATCGTEPTALCQGALSEGTSCDPSTGPKCRAPALCAAGRCIVPSDEACR